jgi:aarF domain-containing kinase
VYKGRLKETGELVAVKVQRPFVLETVTIDLFIIRNLGLVLKRFPQVEIEYSSISLVRNNVKAIFVSSC